MIKILIFGAGFLSANLATRLVAIGAKVSVYSRTFHFESPFTGAECISGDLTDISKIQQALTNIDVVFFLAGNSSPAIAENNRIKDISNSLIGFINLPDTCRDLGLKKIIYASSGGTVYGEGIGRPFNEDDTPLPLSTYGINKLAVEHYMRLYNKLFNMKNISLRISNPFGPYKSIKNQQGVINVLMQKIIHDDVIEIFGSGEQVRDYIYISDLVDAMICVMNYVGHHETFNIGSGVGISLLDIISKIQRVSGLTANIKFKPKRIFDVNSVILNVRRANNELGWHPSQDFESMISLLYNFTIQSDRNTCINAE